MNPLLMADGYKTGHWDQYPKNTNLILTNWTARKNRLAYAEKVVSFGLQAFLLRLNNSFSKFFKADKAEVVEQYRRKISAYLNKEDIDVTHIERLHDLQYIPLAIAAVPEGTLCKIGTPQITVWNTVPEAYWLVGYLETLFSMENWKASTSATIAYYLRKLCDAAAAKTNSDALGFVPWQCHDFSMRGMDSLYAAGMSGMGHILSFNGSDTIPAQEFAEFFYNCKTQITGTVPATEHSVASSSTAALGDDVDSFEIDEKRSIKKIIMKDGTSYLF